MPARRVLPGLLGALCLIISCPVMAKKVLRTYSSGTGFFISRGGYVITNHHVVRSCRGITLSGPMARAPAVLVAHDAAYDLALLKTVASPPGIASLSSMKQPLRRGDPVVIIGYPGNAWKTGQSVMRQAHILNTHGPRGEEKWMEFSDALEKGNSGGPLLDVSGNVVGVVAAKGHAYRYNVTERRKEKERYFDLAISLPVVRKFLDRAGIRYQEMDSGLYQNVRYTAEMAKRFVVNVRCKSAERVIEK